MDNIMQNSDILFILMKKLGRDDIFSLMKSHDTFINAYILLFSHFDTFELKYNEHVLDVLTRFAHKFTKIIVNGKVCRYNWSRLQHLANLTSIIIENASVRIDDIYYMGRDLGKLQVLRLKNTRYAQTIWYDVLQNRKFNITSLTDLELEFNLKLEQFVQNCINLKSLKLRCITTKDYKFIHNALLPSHIIRESIYNFAKRVVDCTYKPAVLFDVNTRVNCDPIFSISSIHIPEEHNICSFLLLLPLANVTSITMNPTTSDFKEIAQLCPKLERLECHKFISTCDHFNILDICYFPILATLSFVRCFINMKTLPQLFDNIRSINSLTFEDCNFTRSQSSEDIRVDSNTHYFEYVTRLKIAGPQYSIVYFLQNYPENFKNVQILYIKNFPDVYFNNLIKLCALQLPKLEHLTIDYCNLRYFSERTLRKLSKMPKLKYLKFIRCANLNMDNITQLRVHINIVEVSFCNRPLFDYV